MMTMTPLMAIGGGMLIGTAAALLLLLSGRIAGVSGMAATAMRMGAGGAPWSQAGAFRPRRSSDVFNRCLPAASTV